MVVKSMPLHNNYVLHIVVMCIIIQYLRPFLPPPLPPSLNCSLTHLLPLPPPQVMGISGPNHGLVGTLINIDEGDGIVKLDADSALKIISLNILAKYVPRQH